MNSTKQSMGETEQQLEEKAIQTEKANQSMEETGQKIEEAEQHLLHTYNRYPVILDRGEGVHLYDTNGKCYLDFCAGIAVQALGYGNEEYKTALKNQIDKLTHTSNYYYNEPSIEAAKKVTKAAGMERIFFTNSGTEAIEGALKAARKYYYHKTGKSGGEIIAMEHSFHGRSMGALSVTGTEKYRTPFEPLIGGVKFANFNDLKSVKAAVTDQTCAILFETIQGEGGIYPATEEFIKGVRTLCDEKDILLILDEIQCGVGRTGSMFAWQQYGVKPDVMTCAKALGCGVPVGAFLLTERVAKTSLTAGDHGTTYGGNPLATAAVSVVMDIFEKEHILEHVRELTPYLESTLDTFVKEYDFVTERRGMGFMQGLELSIPVGDVAAKALDEGLVLITAGANVIRFVPPLVITKEDIDRMHSILKDVMDNFK